MSDHPHTAGEGLLTGLVGRLLASAPRAGTARVDRVAARGHGDLHEVYRALVEQIPAVVFTSFLDRGSNETWVSPQIEALLGFPREEWLSNPIRWYRRIHPEDRARWSLDAARTLMTGEPLSAAYRVLARDGSIVWFQCEMKLDRDAAGRPRFIQGVAFDVTRLKEAEDALRRSHDELERRVAARTADLARANADLGVATEQLKRTGRAKDEFLAVVSHELRTPLNAILGWTRLLRSGKLGPTQAAHAQEVIERNAQLQARLIEDLLDVSRISSGRLVLDRRPVEPRAIIEAAVEAVRPTAEAKAIELDVALGPCPWPVLGDAMRLQQVLWNLLSNAVKFTPQGGRIEIRSRAVGDTALALSVCDTGEGIAPDFLATIFDGFRQFDRSSARCHRGLGLGLTIVRRIVELHGGSVEAASAGIGRGATLTVRLPLYTEKTAACVKARPAFSPEGRMLAGIRVLLVEDDDDSREFLRVLLEQGGLEVEAVASAPEALAAWRARPPAVLISDIEMPGEDGFSLIRQVRAAEPERGPHVTALAVTAHAGEVARQRALAAGYDRHLPKPVDPRALAETLLELVGRLSG